jgi:hypothetical protein
MKQLGNCIVGDMVQVERYTARWMQVRLNPGVYYRRESIFEESFRKVKGLFTALDLGEFIAIRFNDKDDVTAFHRTHHEYL